MRQGAYDYLSKPFKMGEVTIAVRRAVEDRRLREENRRLRDEGGRPYAVTSLLGTPAALPPVLDLIAAAAATESAVLPGGGGRHRQGAGGAGHPLERRAAGGAVRSRELRGHPRHPARVRAVRPREGRVHRGPAQAPGTLRGGRRRHAVPRRDRRHVAGPA